MDLTNEFRMMLEISKGEGEDTEEGWSSLSSDLLHKISCSLNLEGYMAFSMVCKSWRNSPYRSFFRKPRSRVFLLHCFSDNDTANCLIYPYAAEEKEEAVACNSFRLKLPPMAGCTCIASHMGWLLMYDGGRRVFFLSPFTSPPVVIDLPLLPEETQSTPFRLIGHFLSTPTDPNCVVMLLCLGNPRKWQSLLCNRRQPEAWKLTDLVTIGDIVERDLGVPDADTNGPVSFIMDSSFIEVFLQQAQGSLMWKLKQMLTHRFNINSPFLQQKHFQTAIADACRSLRPWKKLVGECGARNKGVTLHVTYPLQSPLRGTGNSRLSFRLDGRACFDAEAGNNFLHVDAIVVEPIVPKVPKDFSWK